MPQKNVLWLVLFPAILVAAGLVGFRYLFSPKVDVIISDSINEFVDAVNKAKIKNKEKLIFLDIDDTLIESTMMLGSPSWFYYKFNQLKQNGASELEAYQIMGEVDRIVQENIVIKPTEENLISAIKYWQKQKYLLVGVTSRTNKLSSVTLAQIKSLGINLESNQFSCVEKYWHSRNAVFKKGIIFVDENKTKGAAFSDFFNLLTGRCAKKVRLIAQADDQKHYIDQGQDVAEKNNVSYVGIIYGKAQSKRAFDVNESNKELKTISNFLQKANIPPRFNSVFGF